MNRKHLFIMFLVMVASAVITRTLPYLFSFDALFFQPVMAMGIFSIFTFRKEKTSILVPIAAMLLSDLVIEMVKPGFGFYPGQAVNYAFLAFSVCLSYFFNPRKAGSVALAALIVPVSFFLLSNGIPVFTASEPYYPKNLNGLALSYDAGFPFLLKDITSTAVFCMLFFGIYQYLVAKRYIKAWA